MTVTAVPLQPVKRGYVAWLWIGIAVALIAAYLLARQGDEFKATPSGLKYHQITAGSGPLPTDGDVAVVMYEGKLPDGTTFDKSQQPTPMPIKGVIPGFSEGLKMMSKGSKYRFWIPANLAYGAKADGPIPANSPLVFDVEMVGFLPEAKFREIMMQQQMMGGGAGGPGGGAGARGGPGAGPGGPGGPPPGAGEEVVPSSGK